MSAATVDVPQVTAPWWTRAWVFAAGSLAVLVGFYYLFHIPAVAHWITYWTGQDNEAGGHYGFFSGFGGALPDILIATGFYAWYWRSSCHNAGCWMPGRHPAAGGTLMMCRYHHPDIAGQRIDHHLTHRLHAEHKGRQWTRRPK